MPNFRGLRLAAAALAVVAGGVYAGEHHFRELPAIVTEEYGEETEAEPASAVFSVPGISEAAVEAAASGAEASEAEGRPVDLNTADRETLMELPGIGEVKADAILRYRSENGPFERPEDLMRVSGIKEGIFGRLKDLVCVGDEASP